MDERFIEAHMPGRSSREVYGKVWAYMGDKFIERHAR